LFQREKQLKGGNCTGVTLDGPYPPAHMVVLEVNEESASPQSAGLVLGHPEHIAGYARQQVSW